MVTHTCGWSSAADSLSSVSRDYADEDYEITARVSEPASRVRGWVRGLFTLRRLPQVGEPRDFFAEVLADEFAAVQRGQGPCCGGQHTWWVGTTPGTGEKKHGADGPG